MAQGIDVDSLFRQLAGGFGAGRPPFGRSSKAMSKAELVRVHDEALGLVVVTLALMASEVTAEQQFLSLK